VGLDEPAGDLMRKLQRVSATRACSRDSRRVAFAWLWERG
jgi:hypothetical protein